MLVPRYRLPSLSVNQRFCYCPLGWYEASDSDGKAGFEIDAGLSQSSRQQIHDAFGERGQSPAYWTQGLSVGQRFAQTDWATPDTAEENISMPTENTRYRGSVFVSNTCAAVAWHGTSQLADRLVATPPLGARLGVCAMFTPYH